MSPKDVWGAIPAAAANPKALLAFMFAVGVFFAVYWRERRLKLLVQSIKNAPEAKRADIIARLVGEPVPPGMTARQFIEYKRDKGKSLTVGLLVIGALLLCLFSMVMYQNVAVRIGTNNGVVNINYDLKSSDRGSAR